MIKNDIDTIRPQEETLNGIYRGVVEDSTSDPEKAGRCRIRVFGVHTEYKGKNDTNGVPTEHLPWAEPALGLFEGSVSGHGSWTVPLQGSHVFLFFESGHILQPRYFASAPGIPTEPPDNNEGFSDPDGNYPETSVNAPHNPHALNEPDFHRLGRNEDTSDTIVQSKTDNKDTGISIANNGSWDEPDPYYSAQYPNNKVFSTYSGITVEIDDTSGEERIHVYHPSNSYIEINKDGNIVIRNANDKYEIIDNNKKVYIVTDYDRTNDKNRTNKVGVDQSEEIGNDQIENIGNDETRTIGNNQTEDISSNKTINVGGQTDETSSSTHTIIASTIHLNP